LITAYIVVSLLRFRLASLPRRAEGGKFSRSPDPDRAAARKTHGPDTILAGRPRI